MTASMADAGAPRASRPFRPNHPWDRNAFLVFTALMWLGIASGFGSDVIRHVQAHDPPYPLIVHVHAAAFMGWLALFTAQVLLIRTRRLALHRKLGFAAIGLAVLMVFLGPATAYVVDHAKFGTPASDPPFIIIQLTDILAFAGLVAAAVVFRNQAATHKRLILLATIYITDAGFARWWAGGLHGLLGDGFWANMAQGYLGPDLLIVGLGAYDLVTRRQLHPAYVAGVAWALALQFTATWLYFAPFWKPISLTLIGHG